MSRSRRFVMGTRASQLAMTQSGLVVDMLRSIHPDGEVVVKKIKTQGDRQQKISLAEIGGQGIFVKELEEALLAGTIDFAVHSLKDVPIDISDGLALVAFPERVDPRDVLVSKSGKGLAELPQGSLIGTGSQRRAVQLLARRPDLRTQEIRGNVDTRLRKTFEGDFDGILLAAAALIRLGWQDKAVEYLPPEICLPAVSQGILGIEARAGDSSVLDFVMPLNHDATRLCAMAERAFLKGLGGGCRAPIAALAVVEGGSLVLDGLAASEDSSEILRDREEGPMSEPEVIGQRLAERVLARGASRFLNLDERKSTWW